MARAFFLYLGSLAVINDDGLFGNESPCEAGQPSVAFDFILYDPEMW